MDVEFVQTNAGEEETWQRSKLRDSRVFRFKDYDVYAVVDGARVKLGRVYQRLATMEQKTPGRTYVNRRWRSPRWFYDVEGATGRYYHRLEHDTKKQATARLVASWESEQKERANAEA